LGNPPISQPLDLAFRGKADFDFTPLTVNNDWKPPVHGMQENSEPQFVVADIAIKIAMRGAQRNFKFLKREGKARLFAAIYKRNLPPRGRRSGGKFPF